MFYTIIAVSLFIALVVGVRLTLRADKHTEE